MGYVERNLVPGEEILLRPRYHWVRFLPGLILALLGTLLASVSVLLPASSGSAPGVLLAIGGVAAVLGLGAIGVRALVDSFDEFAVTSVRVIRKTGFLTRRVIQIPVDKVQDLRLVATLWGRWLSYGNVELESAGEEGPLVFPRIQHPEKMRNVLFAQRAQPPALVAAAHMPGPAPRSVEERLREAERLRASGVLSEDEYRVKREQLIREL